LSRVYNILMVRISILLFLITSLGAFLRFNNLSPFTVYPDSYQNLIVAENLKTYGSVLGFMGQNGMLYPDFFMWTRPVYAGLIALFSNAGAISFILGIAAVPLSYFTFKTIFSKTQALIASLLLALSFNHTVWSGFIMTESSGVFFMLLFLWSFFAGLKRKTCLGSPRDLLTGFLFAVAILTRYEYAIIILPVVYLIRSHSTKTYNLLLNITIGLITTLAIAGYALYPWQSVLPIVFVQLKDLLVIVSVIVIIFIFFMLLFKKLRIYKPSFSYSTKLFIILFAPILLLSIPFMSSFARHDILLSIFSLIGIIYLIKDKHYRVYAYFSLLSFFSLACIYYRINPDMERYMTHTIPFLLIPASYAMYTLLKIENFKLKIIFVTLIILISIQISLSAQGLRYLQDPSWYTVSYEEKVAEKIASKIPDQVRDDNVLLVSMPEPFFLKTKLTTHSLTDTPPFIYIPDALDERTVIIVSDMGMRDYFPNFTKVIETKLQKYKVSEFRVGEKYHTSTKSLDEKYPVKVYEIKLSDLKKLL